MKKIKEVFPDKKKAVLIVFDQNSPYLYLLPAGNKCFNNMSFLA